MRSLFITAAVAAAAVALGSCGYHAVAVRGHPAAPAPEASAVHDHGASEISWFQGTLEEAFSRRGGCPGRGSLFRS